MDKTLHKKLTEKQLPPTIHSLKQQESGGIFGILRHEKRILDALAKDILQPRPEAVAKILELAKTL
jgi:hypothetical protein